MNDENDNPDDKGPDDGEQPLLAGERLAEARRERQISVLEIAKELHLDEAKVRALESNDFGTLGAPVFAKGHLRKYAQIVGIDEGDLLAEYYGLTRSQPLPPVVSERRKPRREPTPGPWIVVGVVVAVIAIAYWLLTRQPAVQEPAASSPAAEEPATVPVDEVEQQDSAPQDPEPQDTEPQVSEPQQSGSGDAAEAAVEPAAIETPEPADAAEPPADGDVRLSILFLGDCWTEISDASGRRLYFNMGREGQSVDLVGEGPLSVLFGDADNVSLTVNGSEFAIPASGRRGRTARFNLFGY